MNTHRIAQDVITRSQPAPEVRRQSATDYDAMTPLQVASVAVCIAVSTAVGGYILTSGIADLAHFNATHLSKGAW